VVESLSGRVVELSLRGAKQRGNLVDYQHVLRLLRFARNDNAGVFQMSRITNRPFPYSTTRPFSHSTTRPIPYSTISSRSAQRITFGTSTMRATLPSPMMVAPDMPSTSLYILPRDLITVWCSPITLSTTMPMR